VRLHLCGKGWVACDALRHVVDLQVLGAISCEIAVVPSRSDAPTPTWQPSLKVTANCLGVPVFESLTAADVRPPDVLISLEYDKIIRIDQLHGARAYNFHFSNLPRYRGCATSVWPLRHDQREAGVTLHVMTEGIDDGPIIAQSIFRIDEATTAFELYRLYHRHALTLFKQELLALLEGALSPKPQDERLATYFARNALDYADRSITEFSRPVTEVCGFVRSLVFPPYQLPLYEGRPVWSADVAALADGDNCQPGFVAAVDDYRALVRCSDGWIRLIFDSEEARRSRP
jgi:methionyl-tRNA formyltransferase